MFRDLYAQQLVERLEAGDDYFEFEVDGLPVPLVFRQPNGRPISTRLDTANWKRVLASTGLPHTRRYQGRHTAASMMIAMGIDVAVVAEILGHAKISFTYDTYVHPLEEAKREASDLPGSFLPVPLRYPL